MPGRNASKFRPSLVETQAGCGFQRAHLQPPRRIPPTPPLFIACFSQIYISLILKLFKYYFHTFFSLLLIPSHSEDNPLTQQLAHSSSFLTKLSSSWRVEGDIKLARSTTLKHLLLCELSVSVYILWSK